MRKLLRMITIFSFSLLLTGLSGCTLSKLLDSKGVLVASAVTVDFENRSGAIIVPVMVNGSSKVYNFMIDTGAGNAISPGLAEELSLKKEFHLLVPTIKGKIEDVPMAIIPQINVGNGVTSLNVAAAIYDMSPMTERTGVVIDGLLGNNFLFKFEVTVDYQNNRLIFQMPYETNIDNIAHGPDTFVMPFDVSIKEGLTPKIMGKINGKVTGEFTVDTGNLGLTFLTHDTAVYLGYLDKGTNLESAELEGEPIGGYTGLYQQPIIGKLESLEFGRMKIGPNLFISAQADANLLGYSVLRNYKITLNYEKRIAVFHRWRDPSAVRSKSTCWIAVGYRADQYFILGLVKSSPAEKAGIHAGDRILSVNGTDVNKLGLEKINAILLDDLEDSVVLTIDGWDKPIRLKKHDLLNFKACILAAPEEIE